MFKECGKKKKPLLSIKYRKRRLDFAFKYKDWTMMDWTRDIWSDNTKVNRIGSDGRIYISKRKVSLCRTRRFRNQ